MESTEVVERSIADGAAVRAHLCIYRSVGTPDRRTSASAAAFASLRAMAHFAKICKIPFPVGELATTKTQGSQTSSPRRANQPRLKYQKMLHLHQTFRVNSRLCSCIGAHTDHQVIASVAADRQQHNMPITHTD
eukprot:IDg16509t1